MKTEKGDNNALLRVDDALPMMFGCRYWVAFVVMAFCVLLLLVWSLAGRINENVYGGGSIIGEGLCNIVCAPANGQVIVLDVAPGDRVSAGQVVGRLYSNDDVEALRRQRGLTDYYRWAYEQNRVIAEGVKTNRMVYSAAEIKRLEEALVRDKKSLAWYADFVTRFPAMAQSGAVSQYQAQEAQDKYDARLLSYDTSAAGLLQENFSWRNVFFSLDHDLFDYASLNVLNRMQNEELLRTVDYRSRIVCHCSGTVVNVNVDVGNEVQRGDELLRVIQDRDAGAATWEVVGYFSAIDAKEIEPGMAALVTPSTVDVEQDGSIIGFVTSVGYDLETEESIFHDFRSLSFARSLMEVCQSMPIKVTVLLSRNLANPSGFDWTSGKGPVLHIPHGTVCSLSVTTQSHSPMNLLLGRVRRLTFGDGIMESSKSLRQTKHLKNAH